MSSSNSSWLFASRARVGRISDEDIRDMPRAGEAFNKVHNISLIDARIKTGFIGHSYFYSHPGVLSDLILILRDGRRAGKEHGRPLERAEGSVFWTIHDEYPAPQDE